jgi:hypothetical protein
MVEYSILRLFIENNELYDKYHSSLKLDFIRQNYPVLHKCFKCLPATSFDAFEANSFVIEQELNHFGESNLKPEDINSERVVNLLVYFAGFEVMPNCDLSNISKTEILELLESE